MLFSCQFELIILSTVEYQSTSNWWSLYNPFLYTWLTLSLNCRWGVTCLKPSNLFVAVKFPAFIAQFIAQTQNCYVFVSLSHHFGKFCPCLLCWQYLMNVVLCPAHIPSRMGTVIFWELLYQVGFGNCRFSHLLLNIACVEFACPGVKSINPLVVGRGQIANKYSYLWFLPLGWELDKLSHCHGSQVANIQLSLALTLFSPLSDRRRSWSGMVTRCRPLRLDCGPRHREWQYCSAFHVDQDPGCSGSATARHLHPLPPEEEQTAHPWCQRHFWSRWFWSMSLYCHPAYN